MAGMATMSREERETFLALPHVGVLGIERPGRGPLTVPIWYAYSPGGDVVILTSPDSLKGKLIAKAGQFSLCAQSESLPYKYVMVEGSVSETRACDVEADARPMAHRYLGKAMGDEYIGGGEDSSSVVISMTPTTWYSVDYGK